LQRSAKNRAADWRRWLPYINNKKIGGRKPMQRNFEEITKELIMLPKRERLEIVRFLLFLDSRSLDTDIESAWEEEIMDRVRAVDEGKATGIDYNKAMKEIEQRFIS